MAKAKAKAKREAGRIMAAPAIPDPDEGWPFTLEVVDTIVATTIGKTRRPVESVVDADGRRWPAREYLRRALNQAAREFHHGCKSEIVSIPTLLQRLGRWRSIQSSCIRVLEALHLGTNDTYSPLLGFDHVLPKVQPKPNDADIVATIEYLNSAAALTVFALDWESKRGKGGAGRQAKATRHDSAAGGMLRNVMGIYELVFQRNAGISRNKTSGKPGGPRLRFAIEVHRALHLAPTDEALAGRIASIGRNRRPTKK